MVISTRIVDVDDLIFGRDERVIPSERKAAAFRRATP